MTKPGPDPVFLERSSYRQRRLRDAVRMMPVLGVILMMFPLMSDGGGTGRIGVYIFGVWILLICVSALLSARMTQDDVGDAPKVKD